MSTWRVGWLKRRPSGARDPLPLLVGTAALAVYQLQGFDAGLIRDLGVYAYAGQRVADGSLPYEGILNRAGPLAHLVPGIGSAVARVVGLDDLLGMRLLLLLVAVAAVVVVYLVGRDLWRSRSAGLVAASSMLAFEGFIRLAAAGPREKTTMVLLVAMALLGMTHQRWGTTGAMIALATLTWQPVAFPAIAGAVVAALLGAGDGWRGRLVALTRMAVGGLLPTALTVVAYAVAGQLRLFVDAFFLINARYTRQESVLDKPMQLAREVAAGYGWSVWLLYGGLLASAGGAVVAASRRTRTGRRPATIVGLGVYSTCAALWSLVAFQGWADAFVGLPVAALGLGGLAPMLGGRLPARAVVATSVVWALVAAGASASYAYSVRSHGLVRQRAEAEQVMGLLPPKARLLCIDQPQPLVLLGLSNPTRLQLFGNGLADYVDDTWPGGIRGYGRWIERQGFEVLVVKKAARHEWLRPVLRESYVRVGGPHAAFPWYVRRDLAASFPPTLAPAERSAESR